MAEGVRAEELDVATLVALGNAVGRAVRGAEFKGSD